MPSLDYDGLDYNNLLKMGVLELDWLQGVYERAAARAVMLGQSEHGWFGRRAGNSTFMDFGWTLYDRDGDGIIRIKLPSDPASDFDSTELWPVPLKIGGVDGNGQIVEVPRIQDFSVGISVPDDSTWYTVVAKHARTIKEAGTLGIVTASTTITGTNTNFTQLLGKSDPSNNTTRGMLLRIDAADTGLGNAGTIEIDTIVSDTELTLVTAPSGTTENGIKFSIAGEFLVAPGAPADTDIHNNTETNFIRKAWIIGQKSGVSTEMIAFDVMRNTALQPGVFVVDRRFSQLYRTMQRDNARMVGYFPTPQMRAPTLGFTPELHIETAGIITFSNQKSMAIERSANQFRDMLVVQGNSFGELESQIWDSINGTFDATTLISVDASGSAFEPSLAKVPRGYGFTHVLVYEKSGSIRQRLTTNNGISWGAETIIWNAPLVDPLDTVHDPYIILTRDYRLIIVASYFDNSTGRREIRSVFSDDFATSWSTNSDAGFLVAADTSGNSFDDLIQPCICQDDGGSLYVAFARTDLVGVTGSELRMLRGQDPNNPAPGGADSDVIGAAYIGSLISADVSSIIAPHTIRGDVGPAGFHKTHRPRLWCGPSGIVCFYSINNDTVSAHEIFIVAAAIGWDKSNAKVARSSVIRMFDEPTANQELLNWGGDVAQDTSGVVHLGYVAIHDEEQSTLIDRVRVMHMHMSHLDRRLEASAEPF